ncbi:hypothetical protein GJ744_002247 [Endocarpon pusillum]|uniref:FAS1 domain-containing protein n=1 Tax=Endocarpon pusillum TaxID=364733 RepID=A0A8H7A945_9EURO|nr:hypothetical protein GJ744_002247 [Endocarpon pusillum]
MWHALYITIVSTVFLGLAFGTDLSSTCEKNGVAPFCESMVRGLPGVTQPAKPETLLLPRSTFERVRRSPVPNIKEMLSLETDWLSYHIFNELLPAATLRAGFGKTMISNNTVANLNGSRQVVISRPSSSGSSLCNNETIKLFSGLGDSATIVEEDIPFDYGLIHIIDHPLTLPRPVSESLVRIGETNFVQELQQAGLKDEVDKTPNVTCFAPTNQALASITQVDNLTPAQRFTLLSNHVVFGTTAYSPDLIDGASLTTTAGTAITVSRRGGDLFLDGARVLQSDVITINGVCHVIDKLESPLR